jgi:hypothetical protein
MAIALATGIVETNKFAPPAYAQSNPPAKASAKPTRESRREARRKLEAEFKRTLTGAVLSGTWQMTNAEGLQGKAPLTDPKPDHYAIDKVSKASDDYWIITARIQYADKDVHIPVTVRVVWAEDVPIITLDETALPGLGTYSAHVMIYRSFYSGTWFGTNYGGILSGQITHPTTSAPTSAPSAP